MSLFYARKSDADIEADQHRAERAAQDKKSLAAIMGPRAAPPQEHNSRLEMAMVLIEDGVYEADEYKGRVEPAAILRNRDACYGVLYRAINNGQLIEDAALQVYREACGAVADQLMAQPTVGSVLCRERVSQIIPKSAFGSAWTWQSAIARGIGRGTIPRNLSGIAIDTLGAEELQPGDEVTGFEERYGVFHIENLDGKTRQVKLSALKELKPRGVVMSPEGLARWNLHFQLSRSSEHGSARD